MKHAYTAAYAELLNSLHPGAEQTGIKPVAEGVAKKYQAKDGGLNAKGRAHFKRTEGANLKPPVSAKAAKKSPAKAKRRKSFCARMEGQKKMHNIDCRANPDKDICKALRKWDC